MHPEVLQWVDRWKSNDRVRVLDIGGRDINGSPRSLFPNADYLAVDLYDGPGVDVVADAASWTPPHPFDVVICTEVFEHTEAWPALVARAFEACAEGGRLIVTCAGPGRGEHSAVDGAWGLKPGEWYRNVSVEELRDVLEACGFVDVEVEQSGNDTRGTGTRRSQESERRSSAQHS